jgi:hypothetical protein
VHDFDEIHHDGIDKDMNFLGRVFRDHTFVTYSLSELDDDSRDRHDSHLFGCLDVLFLDYYNFLIPSARLLSHLQGTAHTKLLGISSILMNAT